MTSRIELTNHGLSLAVDGLGRSKAVRPALRLAFAEETWLDARKYYRVYTESQWRVMCYDDICSEA